MTRDIALVGCGPWGLAALERLVAVVRERAATGVTVHVIDPNEPGPGVYGGDLPHYLILNTPCGQHSMCPLPGPGTDASYEVGFYEWAASEGYQWHGEDCLRRPNGVPVTPHDFLPRALMGGYLAWFYRQLVATLPTDMKVIHHQTRAIALESVGRDHEVVTLEEHHALEVEHVIIASGQTDNVSGEEQIWPSPYPVEGLVDSVADGASVGVTGMGLVAMDVMAALSVGRGGRFVPAETPGRLRYVPSGREPVVYLFSRSGYPYCAKPVSAVDPVGSYRPVICTPEFAAKLREEASTRGGVDLRVELLPLIFAEMQLRYLSQAALLAGGAKLAEETHAALLAAWHQGRFAAQVAALEPTLGAFDAAAHFFGGGGTASLRDSGAYEADVYAAVSRDLDAALVLGGASPVKAAYDVLRALRETMRLVIEYQGLSAESHNDFQANVRTRVNRLVAGPPALRSQQLLALMDAGLLRAPFGPAPVITPLSGGRAAVRSSHLESPAVTELDMVVRGHLDESTVHRSASPLLAHLYDHGRLRRLAYDGVAVGGAAINEDFHPVELDGRVADRIWMFGNPTEGARYFTAYIPSPNSRIRAFHDAAIAAAHIIG